MSNPASLQKQEDVLRLGVPQGQTEGFYSDQGERRDAAVRGLALRVRATGSRSFVFCYRFDGISKKVPIGDATAWTLADARKYARTLRIDLDQDRDPAAVKAERSKTAAVKAETFGELAEKYLALREPSVTPRTKLTMRPKGYAEVVRYLRVSWKPFYELPAGDVTLDLISARLDELATVTLNGKKQRGGPVSADRARTALSSFYRWVCQRRSGVANPVIATAKVADETPRNRVLTDAELVSVWNAANPADDFGRIVRLLILTGCRKDEISSLRWSEIELSEAVGESWIRLPGERVKNGCAHAVPLPEAAAAILRDTYRDPDRDPNRPFVFGRGRKGYSGHWKPKAAVDAKIGIAAWTLHDLRRTFRTGLGRLGIAPHIAEAAINHLPSKLIRTYDANGYEAEKRAALDAWATHVATILAAAKGGNVVRLSAA